VDDEPVLLESAESPVVLLLCASVPELPVLVLPVLLLVEPVLLPDPLPEPDLEPEPEPEPVPVCEPPPVPALPPSTGTSASFNWVTVPVTAVNDEVNFFTSPRHWLSPDGSDDALGEAVTVWVIVAVTVCVTVWVTALEPVSVLDELDESDGLDELEELLLEELVVLVVGE
jgi:hypothetical protein